MASQFQKSLKLLDWAKQAATDLIVQVTKTDPYDIQEFCLDYVRTESFLTEEMDGKIKSSAYENGITKGEVLRVLAVELRDELFRKLGVEQEN